MKMIYAMGFYNLLWRSTKFLFGRLTYQVSMKDLHSCYQYLYIFWLMIGESSAFHSEPASDMEPDISKMSSMPSIPILAALFRMEGVWILDFSFIFLLPGRFCWTLSISKPSIDPSMKDSSSFSLLLNPSMCPTPIFWRFCFTRELFTISLDEYPPQSSFAFSPDAL